MVDFPSSLKRALFESGSVSMTPGFSQELIRTEGQDGIWDYLKRHLTGDWGEVTPEDWEENDLSLREGHLILSAYTLSTGVKFWVITEADRSATTFLLPEEY